MARREVLAHERGADASRRSRLALVVAFLASVGLVVSLVGGAAALWPRLVPGPPVREPEVGPGLVAVPRAVGAPVLDRDRRAPASAAPRTRDGDRAHASVAPPRRRQDRSRPALPPSRLTVPSVGLDLPVRPVGVAEDGQMRLPADPALLGWYRYGPAPGEPGSAVLAGHLDSVQYGLGPLVRLREVEVGDDLVLRTRQGTVLHTVTAVDRYSRQALPDAVFARTGAPQLRVVTCGGEYDEDAGGYQQNLVVTAEPRT